MIPPGSTIGIIGGGQLGRMSAMAAAHMGYKVHIYTPEKECPASQVATYTTVGEYNDKKKLEAFARAVDVITFEFENVPHESVEWLETKAAVYPSASVLKICRNRLREKNFIHSLNIGTASFKRVTSEDEAHAAVKELGLPCILKTTEMGYDGKGQVKILSADEAVKAWETLRRVECVMEGFVEFTMEISVIVARVGSGECTTYVPVQNTHKNHILHETHVPAKLDKALLQEAENIAMKVAMGLNLLGLLAVEMFVTKDGKILVNELAPRPHNSGHWTLDACVTSQFEQHIRAVCALPLGNTNRLCDAVMRNLIGDEVKEWKDYAAKPNVKLHLYGKKEAREGRKMGHVTKLIL